MARISATMSVPPVEAPMSNTMAAPSAGRNTANTRSSMASPLRDTPEGYSHSQPDTKKGERKGGVDRPAHALDAQKDKAQHHQHDVDDPHKAAHVDAGNRSASRMDRPEVPPKAKWLGFLKYTMPTAVSTRPRFNRAKKFRSFSRFSRLKASLNRSWVSSIKKYSNMA